MTLENIAPPEAGFKDVLQKYAEYMQQKNKDEKAFRNAVREMVCLPLLEAEKTCPGCTTKIKLPLSELKGLGIEHFELCLSKICKVAEIIDATMLFHPTDAEDGEVYILTFKIK